MKINEVIQKEAYETGEPNRKLAGIGRVLMDRAAKVKDDALSNMMAKVGDALTHYGTSFGPKSPEDIIKQTGVQKDMLMKLLKFGQAELAKKGDVKTGGDDSAQPDEPEDMGGPSDAEIDRDARDFARG